MFTLSHLSLAKKQVRELRIAVQHVKKYTGTNHTRLSVKKRSVELCFVVCERAPRVCMCTGKFIGTQCRRTTTRIDQKSERSFDFLDEKNQKS